jgi:steroid delta-isomerase-like uncharacterized protein
MTTATIGLDPAFVDAWAQRFLDAWNALDGAAVAELCTEDVVWRDPATPEPMIGRAAVSEFVAMTGSAFPDFHVEETAGHCLIPSLSRVLTPYRMTGRMLGAMDAFAPTGRTISVAGVDQWTFRGERLSGYSTYYDTIDVARQLGIMPAPGSRSERLMVRLQHAQARLQRRSAARGGKVSHAR